MVARHRRFATLTGATMSNVSKYLSKNLELAVYPAFFCIVALPALVVLSLAAGVSVWRSVPESWRVELFLQYGYVLGSVVSECRCANELPAMVALLMPSLVSLLCSLNSHTKYYSSSCYHERKTIMISETSWLHSTSSLHPTSPLLPPESQSVTHLRIA
jgi:hypothetical protein